MRKRTFIDDTGIDDTGRLLGYGVRLRGTYYCRSMPGG